MNSAFWYCFVLIVLLSDTIQAEAAKKEIDSINEKQAKWVGTDNLRERKTYPVGFFGLDPVHPVESRIHKIDKSNIPEYFDARTEWPECQKVIGNIRDQGNCGSCWAFVTAEILSDRLCIKSEGNIKFTASPEDIIQCCKNCSAEGDPCKGGYFNKPWLYFEEEGVVSGGDYDSGEGCKPYSHEAFVQGKVTDCQRRCRNNYNNSYENDKQFSNGSYLLLSGSIEQIQTEIMKYGPVVAGFEVYEDFFHYTNGVYRHSKGEWKGNHGIKLIGWGRENQTDYWLATNSWSKEWGMGGFVKILRGENECRVEEEIFAGEVSAAVQILPTFLLLILVAILYSSAA